MGQYPNFFSTSLAVDREGARVFKSSLVSAVTVLVGGRLYALELGPLDRVPDVRLAGSLASLCQAADLAGRLPEEASPGTLTSGGHATQLKALRRWGRRPDDASTLETLRHTLLTLCLDLDRSPATDAEAALLAHAGNPANRWHLASLQIVVFGNGKACCICAFSAYVDGNAMVRVAGEICRRASAIPLGTDQFPSTPDPLPARPLSLSVPPALSKRALRDFHRIAGPQPATFELPGLGREFFRRLAADPIPTFVIALQMTANRLAGARVEIGQFVTAARYRCMDLVSPSVTTPEVERFVALAECGEVSPAEARRLLNAAVSSQKARCRDARDRLPLDDLLAYYVNSLRGLRRLLVAVFLPFGMRLSRRLGRSPKRRNRQVLISHPGIHECVTVIGRPGVRLPYLECFGLHYQIFEDRTVLTFMPGLALPVSNGVLAASIADDLRRIERMLGQ
jgi:hypothetical protein